jgi:hypothetical protein
LLLVAVDQRGLILHLIWVAVRVLAALEHPLVHLVVVEVLNRNYL